MNPPAGGTVTILYQFICPAYLPLVTIRRRVVHLTGEYSRGLMEQLTRVPQQTSNP